MVLATVSGLGLIYLARLVTGGADSFNDSSFFVLVGASGVEIIFAVSAWLWTTRVTDGDLR